VSEFELGRGDTMLKLRRGPVNAPVLRLRWCHPPCGHAPPGGGPPAAALVSPETDLQGDRLPIVGTFYRSPLPTPLLRRSGDPRGQGQVLCIVEAMKIMHQIESGHHRHDRRDHRGKRAAGGVWQGALPCHPGVRERHDPQGADREPGRGRRPDHPDLPGDGDQDGRRLFDRGQDAMHVRMADQSVCIGPPPGADSYLNVPAISPRSRSRTRTPCTRATASRRERRLRRDLRNYGVRFIGPSSEAIRLMGDKIEARRAVQKVKVPVVPGSDGAVTEEEEGFGSPRRSASL